MKTTLKTIFNFDEELDVSYVEIFHNFAEVDELKDAINAVNKKCATDMYENDNCIYANEGHNIDVLLEHLIEDCPSVTAYNYILEVTIENGVKVTVEPHYDIEMRLW